MAKRPPIEYSSLDSRDPKRRIPLDFDHGDIARPSAQDSESNGDSSDYLSASGVSFFSSPNSVNFRTSSPTTPALTDEVCFGMVGQLCVASG